MKEVYKRSNGSKGVRTVNLDPTMTDQSFADQCDVNNIVRTYEKTGVLPHTTRLVGHYMDTLEVGSYEESLQKVLDANDSFMRLPAKIRDRFANDPAKLIEFMADENNYDEGVKLGLVEQKTQQKTQDEKTNASNATKNQPAKNDVNQNDEGPKK